MAKKAAKGPEPAPPGKKPKGRPVSGTAKGRSPIQVSIRARDKWAGWVEEMRAEVSRRTGLPLANVSRATVVDVALISLAKAYGKPRPPERDE